MKTIHTHNEYRLGDNLVQLNFLRRALICNNVSFVHYFNPELCSGMELLPFIDGVQDRIQIRVSTEKPADSIDSWRGHVHSSHPNRLNFVDFHLEWFEKLSEQMGIANPIKTKDDLLMDYPGLYAPGIPEVDVVVINSPALSWQFTSYNSESYDTLIRGLIAAGYSVLTTKPSGLCQDSSGHGVAWIGAVSARAKVIVGTSTGPSWPCLNVANRDALHIICLDTETVILTERGCVARSVEEAAEILRLKGFL